MSVIVNKKSVIFVLGTRSIYVKTWGCSHNNSDSEYMAGQLSVAGYTITGKQIVSFILRDSIYTTYQILKICVNCAAFTFRCRS
jgi:hypothetical protein